MRGWCCFVFFFRTFLVSGGWRTNILIDFFAALFFGCFGSSGLFCRGSGDCNHGAAERNRVQSAGNRRAKAKRQVEAVLGDWCVFFDASFVLLLSVMCSLFHCCFLSCVWRVRSVQQNPWSSAWRQSRQVSKHFEGVLGRHQRVRQAREFQLVFPARRCAPISWSRFFLSLFFADTLCRLSNESIQSDGLVNHPRSNRVMF